MISCQEFYDICKNQELTYFCGVPDSTFKEWMSFLDDRHGKGLTNRIAAIERDAIAWAAGYYVATGKIGIVYLQNAGFGNMVNPITSLTAREVYNIPMLLMIGWRGKPGTPEEPQHLKMGEIMLPLLELLGIEYTILPDSLAGAEEALMVAKEYMHSQSQPYALIVCKGTFEPYKKQKKMASAYDIIREEALKIIIENLTGDEIIVATTGKTSRELFEYRSATNSGHQRDFLMVGAMGLASSFATEIALQKPDRTVLIIDGDGALLMNAGVLSTIGYYSPKNLYHIVLDNGSHESTGGQPTTSSSVDFQQLALAHSYKGAMTVSSKTALQEAIKEMKQKAYPYMLIVKIRNGSRADLGRPTISPIDRKNALMKELIEN